MSLSKLIDFFSTFSLLPVEINDVRDQIVELGVQDRIIIRPVDIDPLELMGLYYQYKSKKAPYESELCSLVLYSSRLPRDWQRVVCCKEMIHIMDAAAFRTSTEDRLFGLVDRLTRDGSIIDFMKSLGSQFTSPSGFTRTDLEAFKDIAALFQAVAVLTPQEVVEELQPAYRQGLISAQTIATQAQIPIEIVPRIMADDWPEVRNMLSTL